MERNGIRLEKNEYSLQVRKAIEYIETHLSLQLSLNEIAANTFTAPSTLTRNFKRETGMTIGQYIDESIMFQAGQMLRAGKASVLEISEKFGFCDQFSNLIKDLVERVRPLNDPYMLKHGLNILEGKSSSFSFFSAHSANAFGLATSTLIGFRLDKRLRYRGYAAWMYTWATLVALSRVFVGKHYLGDIIAGAAIGALAGYAFACLARHIIIKANL